MIAFDPSEVLGVSLSLRHKQWLKQVIRHEELVPGDLQYEFCTDEEMLQWNVQFLQHDTYTDIITFDNRVGELVSGNILISTDRIVDNAKTFGVSVEEELMRVLVHGVLHLCGYPDKKPEEAEIMRRKEGEALAMLHAM